MRILIPLLGFILSGVLSVFTYPHSISALLGAILFFIILNSFYTTDKTSKDVFLKKDNNSNR
ncbi:hypothetical protein DET59_1072 [Rossellomorea aquimaris]|uniref:Uncharacterized protein n=1 Tax=Rossellomorea aquimaris TaxID=189382 RepID=A0A366EN56_9BACI|nr:hypothetical protein DET59_1072 [Rossellomorea aquimaris]